MTKKRAIARFTISTIIAIIGLVLSFANFLIPGTTDRYNGFINSISLGLDLSGGLSVVYDCSTTGNGDLANSIDATITRLQDVLYSEGYSEASVYKQGSSRIRIEVPDANESDDIFSFLENPQTLYMTLEKADGTNTPTPYIEGKDVTDVFVNYDTQNSKYGVTLRFTTEGAKRFATLTELASSKTNDDEKLIYVYLGEISGNPWGQLQCKEKIEGGSTFISGDNISDYESAKEYALNIMSGTFNVKLTLVENSVISATLGREALTLGLIAAGVAILLIFIIMYLRYRDLGLIANFSLVFYIILMLFFLQAIPFVQLTLPGIAGIILSLGMAVDGNIIIFERIKEEYASGKKMHLAVKGGFKKAFWPIFDSNITTIITSIILYILGTAAIKGFAITLLLGILLSMFTTLVVTRFFVKGYLGINSTKPHRAKLYRDENVEEIGDEVEIIPEAAPQTNEGGDNE